MSLESVSKREEVDIKEVFIEAPVVHSLTDSEMVELVLSQGDIVITMKMTLLTQQKKKKYLWTTK